MNNDMKFPQNNQNNLNCPGVYRNRTNVFVISPSARNKRIFAVFRKADFEYISTINKEEQEKHSEKVNSTIM
jgi:hypothetical protein